MRAYLCAQCVSGAVNKPGFVWEFLCAIYVSVHSLSLFPCYLCDVSQTLPAARACCYNRQAAGALKLAAPRSNTKRLFIVTSIRYIHPPPHTHTPTTSPTPPRSPPTPTPFRAFRLLQFRKVFKSRTNS